MIALLRKENTNAAAKSGVTPIGLCFGRQQLDMIQLHKSKGQLNLLGYANGAFSESREALLANAKSARSLVKRVFKDGKFKGRRVVASMPSGQVKMMSISFPAANKETEMTTIARLAGDRVNDDLSNYAVEYIPIRQSVREGERLGLVVLSPKESVYRFLDLLASAGLSVDALEIGPVALRRFIAASNRPVDETLLMMNTGLESTYLSLMAGRRLLSNQSVEFGESRLLRKIAESLEVTPEMAEQLIGEKGLDIGQTPHGSPDRQTVSALVNIAKPMFLDLAREIDRAFVFAESENQGKSAKTVCLFGGLVRWPGAAELLSRMLEVPVANMSPDMLPFAKSPDSAIESADMVTVTGLCLRGMGYD